VHDFHRRRCRRCHWASLAGRRSWRLGSDHGVPLLQNRRGARAEPPRDAVAAALMHTMTAPATSSSASTFPNLRFVRGFWISIQQAIRNETPTTIPQNAAAWLHGFSPFDVGVSTQRSVGLRPRAEPYGPQSRPLCGRSMKVRTRESGGDIESRGIWAIRRRRVRGVERSREDAVFADNDDLGSAMILGRLVIGLSTISLWTNSNPGRGSPDASDGQRRHATSGHSFDCVRRAGGVPGVRGLRHRERKLAPWVPTFAFGVVFGSPMV
jgi:hypothetical protein